MGRGRKGREKRDGVTEIFKIILNTFLQGG
jgi:hypothetical protein